MSVRLFQGIGWWRYKKGHSHLMTPLREDKAMSRCRRFVIQRPKRELPLVLPDGWTACKNCTKVPPMMPWDNEGRALEDFYQGLYCCFCGATEPCATHYIPDDAYDDFEPEDEDESHEIDRQLAGRWEK